VKLASGTTWTNSGDGAGGAASGGTGDYREDGGMGSRCIRQSGTFIFSGGGGSSVFGNGANGFSASGAINGLSTIVAGAGGGGSLSTNTVTSSVGGTGATGMIRITEFY
jgi:hypothetical protein